MKSVHLPVVQQSTEDIRSMIERLQWCRSSVAGIQQGNKQISRRWRILVNMSSFNSIVQRQKHVDDESYAYL